MATNIQFFIDKPELQELLERLGKCGDVFSVFMKPKPSIAPDFNHPHHPIKALVELEEFKELCQKLGRVNKHINDYSKLNRLEFEGSLVSVLLQGGCGLEPDMSKELASHIVSDGVSAVFPEPFSSITVFRIDDHSWCSLMDEATISSMYIAWESCRGLWWVLCIADYD